MVDIRVLLADGQLPEESFLRDLREFLLNNRVRPLTDQVVAAAPDIVEYDIDCVYYIRTIDRNNAAAIQKRFALALDNYLAWQDTKIGRDINPSVMNRMMMGSGIKRVEIRAPAFRVLRETELSKARTVQTRYGGIEID
jgi:phage-related baseplate assembly protein